MQVHRFQRRPRGLTLLDCLISAIAMALLLTFCLAMSRATSEADNRRRCASNLRMIGQAMQLYANENKNAYPRTRWSGRVERVTPTFGTPYADNAALGAAEGNGTDPFVKPPVDGIDYRPAPNDVTGALYLLMRTQDITSAQFVCPSTRQSRWDFGGGANNALHWTNWPGITSIRDHLSYSLANPYPSTAALDSGFRWTSALPPEFALASDMNSGDDALLKLTVNSTAEACRRVNSLNHDRDGQNVLFGDGHVEMCTTPFVGVNKENIFTAGPSGTNHPKIGGTSITDSPIDADDAVLLPTANDVKRQ